MTASGFRVRVTGLVFAFKSECLVLQQVPNCIRKPKTNTFDKSSFYFGYSWSFQMVSGHFIWFQVVFRSFYVVLDRFRLFQLVPHFSKYQANILFKNYMLLQRKIQKIRENWQKIAKSQFTPICLGYASFSGHTT